MPKVFQFKTVIAILMSFVMTHIPEVASAEAAPRMISTQEVVDLMSREEAEAKVITQLDRKDIQVELKKFGVSSEDAKSRLASLSEIEVRQLASEMENAQYGGVIGILLAVVLVLLIVYLAKRV